MVWNACPERSRRAQHERKYGRLTLAAVLTATLLFGASCASPVGVHRVSGERVQRQLTASILTTSDPSEFSVAVLRRLDLYTLWLRDAPGAMLAIFANLGRTDEPMRLFALAELSFAHAERSGDSRYYLASAIFAYCYAFPNERLLAPRRSDPRLRIAIDLYNRGLAAGLSNLETNEVELKPREIQLPFARFQIQAPDYAFKWGLYELDHFVSVQELEVRGLRNRYRHPGIGMPLAATANSAMDKFEGSDRWIAPESKIPVTAFLRLVDPRMGLSEGIVKGWLEIYTAEDERTVKIIDYLHPIPLEFETSSSLAYSLEASPLWDSEIAGFRSGDFRLPGDPQSNGLFMLHHYKPGLVPIVFVHGTASSPARWAEMFNEYLSDAEIGSKTQLWYFTYNTGNPIAFSGALLRDALSHAVQQLDPNGTDPALRQMVVIGHSQGGLLTKMTSVSSGDRFWRLISDEPFESVQMSDEFRTLMRRTNFIEPLPFVKRIVFIATPHKGSYLADNILGVIARKLVNLPASLTRTTMEFARLNAEGVFKSAISIPTSIDNMRWSNPFLQTLHGLPISPGVHAHSIIAVDQDGPPENGTDGVVAYSSAALDGGDTRFVVRSPHSCQSNPEVIEELRRILYEHLGVESTAVPPLEN